jgi:AcrR family transcriptional regulator
MSHSTTFANLPTEKKEKFIQVALEEFAANDFQSASITAIVKQLGIAKGSVYQYFENKLELWLFLKQHCETVKLSYIKSIKRSDYKIFWSYYRAMFANGINFDLENPLCSQFLYRVGFKESSPQVMPYLDTWKKQAYQMFIQLIKAEKKTGAFGKGNSTEVMAHFMVSMSMSIADLLQDKYHVDFDKNIRTGKPLFGANAKQLMKAVDELIKLLEKALK